jgi:hypothetical protein
MSKRKEVDAWFANYDNPTNRGNLASFYPKSKQHASLMFHLGAKIPGTHPRLEGTGDTSRVLKIGTVKQANAARRDIEKLVRAWCDWRDAEAGGAGRASTGVSTGAKKKRPTRAAAAGRSRAARTSTASRKR